MHIKHFKSSRGLEISNGQINVLFTQIATFSFFFLSQKGENLVSSPKKHIVDNFISDTQGQFDGL